MIDLGKLDIALKKIEKNEKNSDIDKEKRHQNQLLKAEVFIIRGKYQDSIALAKNTQSECGYLQLIKLDSILLESQSLWRMGQFEQTLKIIESGEQEFIKETELESPEFAERYAEFKRIKGICYRFKGELDLAYEYFHESLIEFKKLGINEKIISSLNNIGLTYHDKGELNEAWNHYVECLEMRDKIINQRALTTTYFNLGRIQIDRGELDSALEYLMQSLEMSESYGNARIIAKSYEAIGLVYHNQSKTDPAFEYLSKSLTIKKSLGNDLETSWTLYRMLDLLISINKTDVQTIFFNELDVIYKRNNIDKIINLHYRLIRARIFQESNRTLQKAEAQKIFTEIMFEEILDYELTINAMLNLCGELLAELQTTGNEQILDELIDIFNKLVAVANEQNSYSLITEMYILQSKISLLELDFNKAQNSLSQALSIAEDRGLHRLALKISNQYDALLDQIKEWRGLDSKDTTIIERLQKVELEQFIAGLIHKRSDEVILEKDLPILLMVMTQDGSKVYNKKFVDDDSVNDQMIALFLMAINNIISEAFSDSGSVERLKHGEFMLVSKLVSDLSLLYLFKGNSAYSAIKKLDKFVNELNAEKDLWKKLVELKIEKSTVKSLDTITQHVFNP